MILIIDSFICGWHLVDNNVVLTSRVLGADITQQWPIFAASLQPVKPYLVNELLNEGYLGHKRLYYGDTTLLCMLMQLMLIRHEISWLGMPCSVIMTILF